jgi:hypothetical protein
MSDGQVLLTRWLTAGDGTVELVSILGFNTPLSLQRIAYHDGVAFLGAFLSAIDRPLIKGLGLVDELQRL